MRLFQVMTTETLIQAVLTGTRRADWKG